MRDAHDMTKRDGPGLVRQNALVHFNAGIV